MLNTSRTVLTTDQVCARERAAYWRDLICDVFVQLDCGNVGEEFFGNLQDRPLGPLQLTRVQSGRHEVFRTPRQIAKSAEEYFLISLQMSGRGVLEQDGRAALLQPGDLAIYDSTRSYTLRFADRFEELVLKVPRRLVAERIAAPERLTATRVSGASGMGRVAFDFLRSVADQADGLQPHMVERLSTNIVDVVSAALAERLQATSAATTTRAAQLLRVKSYVNQHLRDADLSRETIAAAHGISVRYLNRLFETEAESVSHWLRGQRLQHIARDLRDPAQAGRSISEIAYAWGMNSMPHFSRVFKTRYHCSPRQYRRQSSFSA